MPHRPRSRRSHRHGDGVALGAIALIGVVVVAAAVSWPARESGSPPEAINPGPAAEQRRAATGFPLAPGAPAAAATVDEIPGPRRPRRSTPLVDDDALLRLARGTDLAWSLGDGEALVITTDATGAEMVHIGASALLVLDANCDARINAGELARLAELTPGLSAADLRALVAAATAVDPRGAAGIE